MILYAFGRQVLLKFNIARWCTRKVCLQLLSRKFIDFDTIRECLPCSFWLVDTIFDSFRTRAMLKLSDATYVKYRW